MAFRQSGSEPVFPQGLQLDRRAITIGAEQRQINFATAQRLQSFRRIHFPHANRRFGPRRLHGAHNRRQVIE